MTWDANRHVIRKIKTAITANIRPLSLVFHEQPSLPWEPFDFLLLEAYQILQDETCPKCGHFVWLCRSNNNRLDFQVRTDTCAADKKLKKAEYDLKPAKDKNTKRDRELISSFGKFQYTVPKMIVGDKKLPTRAEYYKSLQASSPVE